MTNDIIATGLLAGLALLVLAPAVAILSHGYILSNIPPAGGWAWLIAWIVAIAFGYLVMALLVPLVQLVIGAVAMNRV